MSSNFSKTDIHTEQVAQRIPASKSQIEDVTGTNNGKADTSYCS